MSSPKHCCFTTIWNYITLKPFQRYDEGIRSFTTIWNYITLKLLVRNGMLELCFTTIWNYITLKQQLLYIKHYIGFTTIWNYITLKPQISISTCIYLLKFSTSKTAITWQCNPDMVKIYSKI